MRLTGEKLSEIERLYRIGGAGAVSSDIPGLIAAARAANRMRRQLLESLPSLRADRSRQFRAGNLTVASFIDDIIREICAEEAE